MSADLRRAYIANGYRPVPIASGTKYPTTRGWQSIRATADDVATWPDSSTGIICGDVLAVDIDVSAPAIVAELEFAAIEHLGPTPLWRIGRAPREILVYRAAERGVRACSTPVLTLACAKQQVEIKATGQQFVADGIHPDTGGRYAWRDATPATVPLAALPAVTRAELAAFLQAAEAILRKHGAEGAAKPGAVGSVAEPGKPAAGFKAPQDAASVVALLDRLPNNSTRDEYVSNMTAAVACIRALGDDPADPCHPIAAAAIAWAERWEGGEAEDQTAKWVDDFATRTGRLAGWQTLQSFARRTLPGYNAELGVADFAALPDEPEPSRRGRRMLDRLLFPADCVNVRRGYVVKHLLAAGDVGAIIGAPSAGKSILAPYIGYAVAQGREIFGLRTKPGRVLYVAGEDYAGMGQRVHALRLQHGDVGRDFALVDSGSLRDPANAADLRATVAEWKPAVVFIDTVAATWGGIEENSSQDMGQVVALSRALAATGCAVVLVHHTAKQGDGTPRGHSSLNGTLDMSLRLEKGDDKIVRCFLGKNRNGTDQRDMAFRIGSAFLGMDGDDEPEPVTAPIAHELSTVAPAAPRLAPRERRGLAILQSLAVDGNGVAEQAWRDACDDQRLCASDDAKNRAKVTATVLRALIERGAVVAGGGLLRPVGGASEFPALEQAGTGQNGSEQAGTAGGTEPWNKEQTEQRPLGAVPLFQHGELVS